MHLPVLLPGQSHRWRSLVGYSPWRCEVSDTTEWLQFHFSLSYIGEGNGNPLQYSCLNPFQYSCLENPRDRGTWWATAYGVAQSRTRLKRLRSSSSRPQAVYIQLLYLEIKQFTWQFKRIYLWAVRDRTVCFRHPYTVCEMCIWNSYQSWH